MDNVHFTSSNDFRQGCWVQMTPSPSVLTSLASSDFCLFLKLKEYLRGCAFPDDEIIRVACAQQMAGSRRNFVV